MNRRMLAYIVGQILKVEALLMAVPAVFAIIHGEPTVAAFLLSIAACAAAGFACAWKKPQNMAFYSREGFLAVAMSWVLISLFGAMPFFISREIPSLVDALFESVSGFTTTGALVLAYNVETMSRSLILWASITHLLGGMGVLMFVMLVMPLSENRSMHLMRAEVPGPTAEKVLPKMRDQLKALYGIYFALTILEIVLLLIGGLDLFDAVVHAFSTAGTGGYSSKALSVGAYQSPFVEWVITVFMVLFGINFNLFFFVLIKNARALIKNTELKLYLAVIVAASLAIALNILPQTKGFLEAIRLSAFQVTSIMSTTGFATTNFDLWPEFSRMILVLLMFFGACAGSTGGGIKYARALLYWQGIKSGVKQILYPRSVNAIKVDQKVVAQDTLRDAYSYLMCYLGIGISSWIVISLDGFSFETNFSAVVTALNNVGPGIGPVIGPMGNFSEYSPLSKIVLMVDMLFGRLEIFPMLLLLTPAVWKPKAI